MRSGRGKILDSIDANLASLDVSDSVSMIDMNDDASTVINGGTVINAPTVASSSSKSSHRRSSFTWVLGGKSKSKSGKIETVIDDDKDSDTHSVTMSVAPTLSTASVPRRSVAHSSSYQDPSDFDYASSVANIRSPKSHAFTIGNEELATISVDPNFIGNINFGSNIIEMSILNDPPSFMLQEDHQLTLFVRTFFHHSFSLGSFFAKYGNFFQVVLKAIGSKVVESKRANDDSEHYSKWILSVYHMIGSMDSVYEQVIDFFEILRPELRAWLQG